MVRLVRWMLAPALFGLLVGATPVVAQNRSEFVQDEANFFSKEAKAKANAEIARIRDKFKIELIVDTVVGVDVPADMKTKEKEAKFFDEWAEKRFLHEKIKGIYVVIVKNQHILRVQLGNETDKSGVFTKSDRKELKDRLLALLVEMKKEPENQAKRDQVLLTATSFVHERMSQHAARQAAERKQQAPVAQQPAQQGHRADTPWLTYILIGIGILLVFWLIRGIIRGLSGGGVGGPGMAGGGGGGGGGGFFSSMLGGLFGAAAGMWMYSNFFGGHSNSAWGAGSDGGGYGGGNAANSGNDADTGSTGEGGDYGDSGGGGDQGGDAGGGDWGGDGGGGGGGDWGGGGGGGDWGGGGGGGGGGDW